MVYQARKTNLAVKALGDLPVVSRVEDMLGVLHRFFAHSLKRHLQFQKLAEVMNSKELKILKNIKTRWISMLLFAIKVLNEYNVLLVKMEGDLCPTSVIEDGKKGKKDKGLHHISVPSPCAKF